MGAAEGGSAFDAACARGCAELRAATRRPGSPTCRIPTPRCSCARWTTGTGYGGAHLVNGEGPVGGCALLWAAGCAAERERAGLLSAGSLEV